MLITQVLILSIFDHFVENYFSMYGYQRIIHTSDYYALCGNNQLYKKLLFKN